jgi:hypothetical protein
MKRYPIVLALFVALAVPAIAIAGVRHFKGPIDPSGNVSFDTKVRHGRIVKVKSGNPGFEFNHLPMTCNEGERTISGGFTFAMEVNHRHFSGTGIYNSSAGSGRVAVTGKFKHHGRKAVGTINGRGNFAPESGENITGCHSGKLDWHAHAR